MLLSSCADWEVCLGVMLVPMTGAANLFGKDVPDAPSETVILSWTASLVWNVEVSMVHHRQLD